ncbi:S1 RNA-binding domain-containing protein [Microtetraspora malaysiensis]|uniref:S1 RNA-binding domain-containing protein n=1 Tax=Microtetraspora malaysiensis TaxID=161358 RepID=UPI003D8B259F
MVVEGGQSDAVLEFLRTLEPGQVRRGVVTSVERFGVFMDLDGADGLVRVPELSWRRFEDASEIVQVGQELVVMVLYVDLERAQVSLSLKALQSDPWLEIARTRLGEVLAGPVTKVAPIGAFVAVADGVEGLIPISDFRGGQLPAESQNLTVRIRDINLRHRRMKLGLV